MRMSMAPTMRLEDPTESVTIIGKKRVSDTPLRHAPDWERIAEHLYKELDAIEVMSDPTLPAPEGIDRMKQINMFARNAVQSYILSKQEKT